MKKITGYTLLGSMFLFIVFGIPYIAGSPWWVSWAVLSIVTAMLGFIYLAMWLITS